MGEALCRDCGQPGNKHPFFIAPDDLCRTFTPWDAPPATKDPVGSDGQTPHYGDKDDPYEVIKVIEAWGLGFHLGNVMKYCARAGKKQGEDPVKGLKKALFYLRRKIERLEAGEPL